MVDRSAGGTIEGAMSGFAAASKSLQSFTAEVTRMQKDSVDQTSQLVEKLRGARTFEDVVAIQTNFMQQSLSNYADYARRFGELLTTLPIEMAKQGQGVARQGAETVARGAEQMGEQAERVAETAQQHQGFGDHHG